MSKERKAFGLWNSPITPQMIGDSIRLNDVQWDSDGETLVWSESRGKKGVLVAKRGNEAIRDITDSSFSPRGGVGYGGGEFTVYDGQVYFVSGGRIYKTALSGGMPKAITPKFGGAAISHVSPDGKWLAFAHTYEDNDVLAIVDTDGQMFPQKIADNDDFVMQAAWHPDGNLIAYIAWNFPQMPWDGTELRIIPLIYDVRGVPYAAEEKTIAGDTKTAIFQPEFSPDGKYLAYASDTSGWWHLYLYDLASGEHKQITEGEIEHGVPAWVQGLHTYAWTSDSSTIYYIRHDKAIYSVWKYDLESETHSQINEIDSYKYFSHLSVSPKDNKLAILAADSTIPSRVIAYDAESGVQVARRSTTESLTNDYLSPCEAISWEGHDGEQAHGLYYAPKNPAYEGIDKPPLMVLVHGGPTSQRNATFDMEVQFFTTRGFAVLQVNHRGSTGYGKAYMNKHQGNWGVYDVQDSITGSKYLAQLGLANAEKLVIMGGSAGGYTVLQALVSKPNFFKAGVCSYGISNQFLLAMDTHKFEARYSDWLLGELPEAAKIYRDRSPIFHANRIQDAIIVFQGADDVVVPKNQSDMIVAALRRGSVPHEYIVYEGEGHGFRKPETKIDFYNKVMDFLKQHVIFA